MMNIVLTDEDSKIGCGDGKTDKLSDSELEAIKLFKTGKYT